MGVINFLKSIDRVMGGPILGSIIGMFLVFLLLGFVSKKIFDSGHHGDDEPLAFALEIEDEAPAEEEVAVDYAALVASADLGKGEKVFSKCKACHKMAEGENGVGPHLWGVVGRDIGSVGEYAYGDFLASAEGDWELENLSAFLENPKGWAPGTKMSFAGLKKPEDRVNLIAWLNEADGSPIELAAAPAEVATDAVVETEEAPAAVEDAVEDPAPEAADEEAAVEEEAVEASEEVAAVSEETATEEAATEEAATEEAATEEAATEEAADRRSCYRRDRYRRSCDRRSCDRRHDHGCRRRGRGACPGNGTGGRDCCCRNRAVR